MTPAAGGSSGCCDRESKRSPTFGLLVRCLPLPPLLPHLAGQEAPEGGQDQDEPHRCWDAKDQEGAGQVCRGDGGCQGGGGGCSAGLCCGARCRQRQEGESWRGKERGSVTHPASQPQSRGGGEGEWLFTATHPPPATNRPPA